MFRELAVITGAANGIGRCLAEEFLRGGYDIILTDIDGCKLKEVVEELISSHINSGALVYGRVCDVSDKFSVSKLVHDVIHMYGNPAVIVNNAGIGYNGEMADMKVDDWKDLIDVNLMGPIHHIYEFLPYMKAVGGGHIVNVSSGQAFFRLPTWGAYAAIKTALGVMSELLSFELSKYGVMVTTVYPFMVDTSFYKCDCSNTIVGNLSMKLLPYYSDTPEKVAKKIFKAVKDRKRKEIVNPINLIGLAMRSFPPVADMITYLANKLLTKRL